MPLMEAPESGVNVRMYRQGHGDCFLLAFPREGGGDPVYVLIDCGYKPGSQAFLSHGQSIGDVVKHIGESTNHQLDLAIITHEHQDHVNGIWKKSNPYFKEFTIQEAWFAWTEDPDDALANELRRRHHDQLVGLIKCRNQLALAVNDGDQSVRRLDSLLELETGFEGEDFRIDAVLAAASDPMKSVNKQAMKLIKDKAGKNRGTRYLRPKRAPRFIEGAIGVRAFVLGPPRAADLIADEDPKGDEAFPGHAISDHGFSFTAAAHAAESDRVSPFRPAYCLTPEQARTVPFFRDRYGFQNGQSESTEIFDIDKEADDNAAWRRIDSDWLYTAESLALKLNSGINNTSLVLAFELPNTKKVLLFVGDAQRGNWISWTDQFWKNGNEKITVRDLLARTVLYKVGHHGSHNATLDGGTDADHPNLAWMGIDFASEFTAMITAVNEWAMTKNDPPWRHPLPSIRKALLKKCQGRVFQTDIDEPKKPANGNANGDWSAFSSRSTFDELYFEYTITD